MTVKLICKFIDGDAEHDAIATFVRGWVVLDRQEWNPGSEYEWDSSDVSDMEFLDKTDIYFETEDLINEADSERWNDVEERRHQLSIQQWRENDLYSKWLVERYGEYDLES